MESILFLLLEVAALAIATRATSLLFDRVEWQGERRRLDDCKKKLDLIDERLADEGNEDTTAKRLGRRRVELSARMDVLLGALPHSDIPRELKDKAAGILQLWCELPWYRRSFVFGWRDMPFWYAILTPLIVYIYFFTAFQLARIVWYFPSDFDTFRSQAVVAAILICAAVIVQNVAKCFYTRARQMQINERYVQSRIDGSIKA